MSWKRYPEYKDSGVEWLGNVPVGWQVKRLRFNILTNPTKAEVKSITGDTLVSFVPMESVSEYGGLSLDQTKSLDEVSNGYTYFCNGDVLVAKITPCFENGKGSIAEGLENGIGFGTTELHVLRPKKKIDFRYLFYLTISYAFRQIGKSYMYGAGGQKRVPDDFIRNLRHPIPDISEQCIIAAFLDRETERIDELIAKKERQIKLLQEKRAALISHAVTKGLSPDVKMKDSGIEWLRDIPESWDVIRFKYVLSVPLQYGANESAQYDEPSWPRYIRITDVNENGNLRDDTFKSLPEEVAVPYLLHEGDLLFARSGATVGKTFLYLKSWGRAAYAGYLIRGRFQQQCMMPTFAAYFCRSYNYWDWLRSSFIQATIQNVSAERYANMIIPIPPLPEQTSISAFLDRETKRIDTLINKVQESIAKLSEYRTALISAAVTGKIDVRGSV